MKLDNGNSANVYKSQNERLQESIRELSDDIKKGNEIISKLQGDVKSYKGKLKLKNVVTLQQEKLLHERLELLETHRTEAVEIREKCENLEKEVMKLRDHETDSLKQVEILKKTIADNNQGL